MRRNQLTYREAREKWQSILEHPDLPAITDPIRRDAVAMILENQALDVADQMQGSGGYHGANLLGEAAPTNAMGASSSTAGDGSIDIYDPVLISLVRRSMPNLIAYDVCGVQPMTGPSGLIFAIRPRHTSQTGDEALYNEANTFFSGSNTAASWGHSSDTDPSQANSTNYIWGTGMSTAAAEALGDGVTGNDFTEMAFSVEKVTVTAVSRALKAEYTMELAQDLKAIHGLDAETELGNILSAEILAEINREVIRKINGTATIGAQENTTTAGIFDLDTDSNGRWMVEKFKGLMFQLEREANQIAKATRRGKGNIVVCSSDVA